jgi:hypothetical protein
MVSPFLAELPLYLLTAAATHLVMSFAQTVMHYKLGHHPMGGKFFRNHITFHHSYYSKDHIVSRTYLGDEGNNTPFFFIPVFLAAACTYLILPLDLFFVQVAACAASFYAHVFFDKEYHVEGSLLQRFAWFRRKQELHFVHHRHANSNFAVIHFFWDRVLGTYRKVDAASTQTAAPTILPHAPGGILLMPQLCPRTTGVKVVRRFAERPVPPDGAPNTSIRQPRTRGVPFRYWSHAEPPR